MYIELMRYFRSLAESNGILDSRVQVDARGLTVVEAIGHTHRKDYPLLRGKETLMQAVFNGAIGQAFTDMPLRFSGSISDVLNLALDTSGERALFISTLNAVMRSLGLIEKTVHCKGEEPETCATKIVEEVISLYGRDICVGIVGYQPAIIENFAQQLSPMQVRVIDLDSDNIGDTRYGVEIWDGVLREKELFAECDVVLATGSTIINKSIEKLINHANAFNKPIYFYGTSIAGPAIALNLNRLCHMAA